MFHGNVLFSVLYPQHSVHKLNTAPSTLFSKYRTQLCVLIFSGYAVSLKYRAQQCYQSSAPSTVSSNIVKNVSSGIKKKRISGTKSTANPITIHSPHRYLATCCILSRRLMGCRTQQPSATFLEVAQSCD